MKFLLLIGAAVFFPLPSADAATYYVSSSLGSDTNDGLSEGSPFKSIEKVNTLALIPGDHVLFRCGDIWRKEQLKITRPGSEENEILFGSYPAGCDQKPIISGSLPVTGWQPYSGNIFVADITEGDNAVNFAVPPSGEVIGLNQLFRNGKRLLLGRWPNLDDDEDNGYSAIETQPSSTAITDNELPNGDWSGAVVHIKSMRWLILNRIVVGSSGNTLNLGESTECYGGTCAGWGYFINNSINALDQDGEWFFDEDGKKVYLYSDLGVPTNIEGSVILSEETGGAGGIVLGGSSPIVHVIVENFMVKNWFAQGITTPTSMGHEENAHVTLRNNAVADVDDTGLRLISWIWDAAQGPDCHRGGHHMEVSGNTVCGANHFGIDTFSHDSLYLENTVKDIGLIENLGKSGMGCGFSGSSCTENGDGIRIRSWEPDYAGFNNLFQFNVIERTGYNGMDVFGARNTIENNYFKEVCYSKGDCGAIRTFGRDNLTSTNVHDIVIRGNVINKSIGNTDGTTEQYRALFGMGLYIDHYSRDVLSEGNTIIDTTISGIYYGSSTGNIKDNTVYDCANNGDMYSSNISIYGTGTQIGSLTGNVMYAINEKAWTLGTDDVNKILISDYNYFFHPFVVDQVCYRKWDRIAFEEWQILTGKDVNSKSNWFSLSLGEPPISTVFFNDLNTPKKINLWNRKFLDLDRNGVKGSITLEVYGSKVLVGNGRISLPHLLLLLQ